MTLDELFEKYYEAWSAVARQTDGDMQSAGRAGIRAVVVALRDEGHATLGGELDLVLEAHLAGPTQPLLRSGQVTEEEAKRAVRVYMDNDSPDVEETWAAVLTDFLANRGINTEPAEFTDEQIDAAIEAWRKSGGGPSGMRAALRAAGARP